MPGPFAIQNANGTKTLDFLSEAPAQDNGQDALPVRILSQLGAGTGGGGATGGLTDAELRASPVPVSIAGGGSSAGLTDVELRASPVPVSGTVGVSGTIPVSGPLTDAQLRASAVPVSGVFYQGTQPVSAAALPLPVGASTEATLALIKAKTDNLDVLLSTRTKPADIQAVSGTFWQATQPVSGPLTDAQLRAAAVPVSGVFWPATQPISLQAADKAVSVTAAAGAAVTATLPAVAGQFHYITRINIIAYAAVARTGAATPVVVTSTNLPGSLAWTTPTAAAVGTQYETDIQLSGPLKSSAVGVATTIVAPAATSVIWRINVVYYTGT